MTSPAQVIDEELIVDEQTAATPSGVEQSSWAKNLVVCPPDWIQVPPKPRVYLLSDTRSNPPSGVLPLGKTALLLGEGGISKTMSLVGLALAVATGRAWMGCFAASTCGKVLIVLGEEEHEEVRRRVYNVARATRSPVPPPGSIIALPLAGVPCAMLDSHQHIGLVDSAFLIWLRAEVKSRGPFALIIVDPLSRFAGADAEIDNAAATRFIQALESLAAQSGATVMVAHHTNKASRSGGAVSGVAARGSSAIYDGVRWAASLSAQPVEMGEGDVFKDLAEVVTLSVVKSNYGPRSEPILLRRDADNGGALLPLDSVERDIVSAARRNTRPSARKAERARADIAEVCNAIREVLRERDGLSGRKLLPAVAARRGGCSQPVLNAAIESMGDEIWTEPGPDRSLLHHLRSRRPAGSPEGAPGHPDKE